MKPWQSFILGILVGLVVSAVGFLLLQRPKDQPLVLLRSTPTIQEDQKDSAKANLLNLNTADLKELDTLPGIGQEKAQSIIDFRTKYGPFRSKEDLLYVPGIGQSLYDQIQDEVFVD